MKLFVYSYLIWWILHPICLLLMGYSWVITGEQFPPFAKFEDAISFFGFITLIGACGLAPAFFYLTDNT